MAVKKTIAVITEKRGAGTEIANKLAKENSRILFVTKDDEKFTKLISDILDENQKDEIEILQCMKDGCWEADFVILDIDSFEKPVVAENIREVAIQKIVVNFINEGKAGENEVLQKLLPNSKVVMAFKKSQSPEAIIWGNDEDALNNVSDLFKTAGISLKIAEMVE